MMPPRTYEIQSGYALRMLTGKEVVAWAVDALVAGLDSKSLRVVAGLDSPADEAELGRLYPAVLNELGIQPLAEGLHVRFYTTCVLRKMLSGNIGKKEALQSLSDLCFARGYEKELMAFYLLYYAKRDLEIEPVQWYWPAAGRSNVDQIIDEYSRQWLETHAIQEA